MVSVQRSIEIRVPVHALYSQLTQFEQYPQFMQDVESVEQRDESHLHWKATLMDQPVEWDATITERVPDRCIAWQSDSGPGNSGRVELQSVGPAASRLTLTMVSEIDFEPSSPAGDAKAEFSERIWEDLARLRSMVEDRERPVVQSAATLGHAASSEGATRSSKEGTAPGASSAAGSGFAAGSEGFSGNEDPSSPVLSAAQFQPRDPTQSDYSLSQGSRAENAATSIAEEVSVDQQSEFARHVGQLSTDELNDENPGMPNREVIAKAAQRIRPEPEF